MVRASRIAGLHFRKVYTADHHLANAAAKLRARNRTHAVAKALVFGIIDL